MRASAEVARQRVSRRIVLLSAARLGSGALTLPLAAACSQPIRTAAEAQAAAKASSETRGSQPPAVPESNWPFPEFSIPTLNGYSMKVEGKKVTLLGPSANGIQATITIYADPDYRGESVRDFALRREKQDMENAGGKEGGLDVIASTRTYKETAAWKIIGAVDVGKQQSSWVHYEAVYFAHRGKGFGIVYKAPQDVHRVDRSMNKIMFNTELH